MTAATARVLGWFVIAHGLAHSALAVHYGLLAAVWIDALPVVLFIVAMMAFLAAGFGLLQMRPLNATVAPMLVLASGLSLVAILQSGEPALWVGAACDAALLMSGWWRGYRGWPVHANQRA
jgi:hypothetical protein